MGPSGGACVLARRSMQPSPLHHWAVAVLLLAMNDCNTVVRADGEAGTKLHVYMVMLRGDLPVVHYNGSLPSFAATAAALGAKVDVSRQSVKDYVKYLVRTQDTLLAHLFERGTYRKLYSYHHLINGFAVHISPQQAEVLRKAPEVAYLEKDSLLKTMTTHTPDYLELPQIAWCQLGGFENAGEGITVGFVDTGIDPTHSSFSNLGTKPYGAAPASYTGTCEVASEFPMGSCNGKIVGAQHFAQAAISSGQFNASFHFASPLDGDGHGTHTASTAAGNHGVPVIVDGINYGNASGMAPRARIAVYKALYRNLGGFSADVVAAIDQAAQDGVDVLSLSLGPNGPPENMATFLNAFEVALLSAVKAGTFVTQAAGNLGPFPSSMLSFSPWITSVAASIHDRTYPNSVSLGNNQQISGIGLSPPTAGKELYNLVLSSDVHSKTAGANSFSSDIDMCQNSSDFEPALIEGKILICIYDPDFFMFGTATLAQTATTAKDLGAVGFILAIKYEADNLRIDPVPLGPLPGIIIPSFQDATMLLQYYNASVTRNAAGYVTSFGGQGRISGGQQAVYSGNPPMVAAFSSRGPDVNNDTRMPADVLKPDIMAPGYLIWAAWSSIGVDSQEYNGQNFAMVSGTSMATPHIAGIAVLVKEKYPTWSPASIASALVTTASVADKNGNPLVVQNASVGSPIGVLAATPFDFGGGSVNTAAALDPGLVFDAGFADYVHFLCSVPGVTISQVLTATGATCGSANGQPSDLNTPSITLANLIGSCSVPRTVTNVAGSETYTASVNQPLGVTGTVTPSSFNIASGESQIVTVTLKATASSPEVSFGALIFKGSLGHTVRIPISVGKKTMM